MKLNLKNFRISTGRPIAFINEKDAKALDLYTNDSVELKYKKKKIIARLDLTSNLVSAKQIALSDDILEYFQTNSGVIELIPSQKPKSALYISKKLSGKSLSRKEIFTIIHNIVDNSLNEVEIAQFVLGVYKNGMTKQETIYLTEAMCKTGSVINWQMKPIVDKHCIGGIAGNRTTPIVVSICASAGIVMPKTSSRAITSAAGTADVIETLTRVSFPVEELKRIVKKTNACLAWGGSLGLAPADDKLIRIERVLNLDPESQLIASILSKKLAVGSQYVLIDIPCGEGAKVSKNEAINLKKKFLLIGKHFKLKLKVVITDGNQPVGNGIGPVLEMIDVLKVLKRHNSPLDLENKSLYLSAEIISMTNGIPYKKAYEQAKEILNSGKAYAKFKEIVNEQGATSKRLVPGKFRVKIVSRKAGKVVLIDNKKINYVARTLGCPLDKPAGLYLLKHKGDIIRKGDVLALLFADSKEKLREAEEIFHKSKPFTVL